MPVAQGEVKASVAAAWLAARRPGQGAGPDPAGASGKERPARRHWCCKVVCRPRPAKSRVRQESIENADCGQRQRTGRGLGLQGRPDPPVPGRCGANRDRLPEGLDLDPRLIPAHAGLIAVRLRAGDLEGANKQAAALRAVWPNHPMTAFVDGQLAFQQRDFTAAHGIARRRCSRSLPNEIAGAATGRRHRGRGRLHFSWPSPTWRGRCNCSQTWLMQGTCWRAF
ncbi:MAG: hypothetical protein MZW92_27050 [Comamonadaceae bacterium]|nr:hypothetical protein [Comamonadaceae bacterium]